MSSNKCRYCAASDCRFDCHQCPSLAECNTDMHFTWEPHTMVKREPLIYPPGHPEFGKEVKKVDVQKLTEY